MFNKTLGLKDDEEFPWPEEVVALAIDPKYSPAILTVGSYEYIYGRKNEAMKLFLTLPTLPEDTEEITEIIDKAGEFLIDNQDYNNALTLYSTAIRKHPNIALYYNGSGYCFGKSVAQHNLYLSQMKNTDTFMDAVQAYMEYYPYIKKRPMASIPLP